MWLHHIDNTQVLILYLFCIVNIVGADVLAMQGPRASATMELTILNQINSVTSR